MIGTPFFQANKKLQRESITRILVVVVLFLAITTAMLPLISFYSRHYLTGDIAQQYLPLKAAALKAFQGREAALWNPYLFSGSPLLADPQNSLIYPAQLLFLFLPLDTAFLIHQYLHIMILAIGTYKLARLYVKRLPALTGALVFTLSGPVFFRLHDGLTTNLQSMAWIPWIFLCVELYWRSRRPFWLLCGALVIFLQILAGFPTLSFYTLATLGLFLIYRSWELILNRNWQQLVGVGVWFGLMFVFAFMLSAVQILPSAEFIALSSRAEPSFEFVREGSITLYNLVTVFLPEILGSMITHTAIQGIHWGRYNLYAGTLPVLLVLIYLGFFKRHKIDGSGVYSFLTIVAFIWSFGVYNPLYKLLFDLHLPIVKNLSDPFRMNMLYVFTLSIVTAIAIEQLPEWLPTIPHWGARFTKWCIIAVSAATASALLVLTFGQNILNELAEPLIVSRYGDQAQEKIGELDTLYFTQSITLLVFMVIVLAGGWLIYARMTSKISSQAFMLVAALIVVADVWLFAFRLMTDMRPFDKMQTPVYATTLTDQQIAFDRVLPLNAMVFINHGSRFSVPAITGYNPLILSYYLDLLGVIRGESFDPAERVPLIDTYELPLLDLLAVEYLISYEPLQNPDLRLLDTGDVFSGGDTLDVYIYQLNRPAERAFIVHEAEYYENRETLIDRLAEPSFRYKEVVLIEGTGPDVVQFTTSSESRVEILGATMNSITLETYADTPGWLVLTDTYFPGWKVFVDGRETNIKQANLALRAVELPEGEHLVEFIYSPETVRYGVWITLSGLLLFVVLLFFEHRLYA
jgi:hypothetical protein